MNGFTFHQEQQLLESKLHQIFAEHDGMHLVRKGVRDEWHMRHPTHPIDPDFLHHLVNFLVFNAPPPINFDDEAQFLELCVIFNALAGHRGAAAFGVINILRDFFIDKYGPWFGDVLDRHSAFSEGTIYQAIDNHTILFENQD